MKCPSCGHWNRVPVNKIFIEQPSSEPKVKVLIPMYEPLDSLEKREDIEIVEVETRYMKNRDKGIGLKVTVRKMC